MQVQEGRVFYYDPDDPAYFVEKAMGTGIDFNYVHWPAKVFLVFVVALVVVPILLAALS
ncbi:DUF5808 domain-containing protein [Corynebacterium argentoratense]|uniref:DUF5808 domain-containing protein n=1 Tax=Corynebacterium argentoratense TaxID=42817 RepID=UPI002E136908